MPLRLVPFVLALIAIPLAGQDYPLPASTDEPPAICTTCAPPLPTWPYDPAKLDFLGRYLDSTGVRPFQGPVRTYRAFEVAVVPELDRIFMIAGGGTFASYEMSEFIVDLGSTPMATASHGEKHLPFFSSVYAEARDSGWVIFPTDAFQVLTGFDWDARGFRYLAYSNSGWGIVRDDGSLVSQVISGPTSAVHIVAFRDGGAHHVAVTNELSTSIYDVTDPSSPAFIATHPFGFTGSSKISHGESDTVALVDRSGVVNIYSAAHLIAGSSPLAVFEPQPDHRFFDVATDGLRWFAVESPRSLANPASTTISILASEGDEFAQAIVPLPGEIRGYFLEVERGLLAVFGFAPDSDDIAMRLYRIGEDGVTPIEDEFFGSYYLSPPAGFAKPGFSVFSDAALTSRDGAYLLFFASQGLGDVYRVEVPANESPVLSEVSISPQSLLIGSELRFMLSATDAGGGELRYHAAGLPEGASLDSATGEFVWVPAAGQIGLHHVRFGIVDAEGAVVWQDVVLALLPTLSIEDAEVEEGDPGSSLPAQLTVTLSNPSGSEVRVDWSVVGGTATEGSDYLPAGGSLIFEPGEVSKTIELTIVGDDVPEVDETLEVELSSPEGATLAVATATLTIISGEALPIPLSSPWVLGLLAIAMAALSMFRLRS